MSFIYWENHLMRNVKGVETQICVMINQQKLTEMKTEFYKSVAVSNILKEIWVVSLDDGDIIPIIKWTYVDDTCEWKIGNYLFHTHKEYTLENIIKSFMDSKELKDFVDNLQKNLHTNG